MAREPALELRGSLIRRLATLREMLPGSFVESNVTCGKAGCRCAKGKELHRQYLLSVLVDGKPRTFHIPAEMIEQVRQQVEMHKDFRQAEAKICGINLEIFLKQKEERRMEQNKRRESRSGRDRGPRR